MPAAVWDERATPTPDGICQACGMAVRLWVAFEGYGGGFQVCPECLADAAKALEEREARLEGGDPPRNPNPLAS